MAKRFGSLKQLQLLLITLAMDAGCGAWLGNPKGPAKPSQPTGNSEISLKIQGTSMSLALLASPAIAVTGKSGAIIGSLALTTAEIALESINLKPTSDDSATRQEFSGPYTVDLLTSTIQPDPGTIAVPSGTYKDIELKLHHLEEGEAAPGDAMLGKSIQLVGMFTGTDGNARPFSMSFALDEDFHLGKTGSTYAGMNIAEGQVNPVIIAFRLDRWFNFSGKEGDLADLSAGAITIDDSSDATGQKVREAIKDNIEGSGQFGKDEKGTGHLDPSDASD